MSQPAMPPGIPTRFTRGLPVAACVAYLVPHVAASAHPPGWFHRAMPPNRRQVRFEVEAFFSAGLLRLISCNAGSPLLL
jgi:hypothetical protein